MSYSKISELYFVQKLKIPLMVFAGITALSLIPTSILNAIYRTFLFSSIYYAAVGTVTITQIILLVYSGSRFLRVVSQVWKSTKEPHLRNFLKRVTNSQFFSHLQATYSILVAAVSLVFVLIISIMYPFLALHNAWWFLGLNFAIRTAEAVSVVCLLIVAVKKRPQRVKESQSSYTSSELSKRNSLASGSSLP